jgi:hypothetical protein
MQSAETDSKREIVTYSATTKQCFVVDCTIASASTNHIAMTHESWGEPGNWIAAGSDKRVWKNICPASPLPAVSRESGASRRGNFGSGCLPRRPCELYLYLQSTRRLPTTLPSASRPGGASPARQFSRVWACICTLRRVIEAPSPGPAIYGANLSTELAPFGLGLIAYYSFFRRTIDNALNESDAQFQTLFAPDRKPSSRHIVGGCLISLYPVSCAQLNCDGAHRMVPPSPVPQDLAD